MVQAQPPFRRDLLGVDHTVATLEIRLESVREYCRIIGEENPLYTDTEAARQRGFRSVLAPAAFLGLYVSDRSYPDIELDFPGVQVKGGQSIELLKPVQMGDVLAIKVHLKDVYTKTGRSGVMAFVVWENTFVNQDGDLVARARDHYIYYPQRPKKA